MKMSSFAVVTQRPHLALCAGILIPIALIFSGCATIVKVDSNPPGASVTVGGKSAGTTPTQLQIETASKSVDVEFSLSGYFPERISYLAGNNPAPIFAKLEPTKLGKSFEIRTEPSGAAVILNGATKGRTPVTLPIEFLRD